MILLDTNFISELMKPVPDKKVLAWLQQHPAQDLFISSITIAEICYGLNALPAGKRRETLQNAFKQVVQLGFKYRVLDFDI